MFKRTRNCMIRTTPCNAAGRGDANVTELEMRWMNEDWASDRCVGQVAAAAAGGDMLTAAASYH